jgi:two-component system OmpR family response regulator
MRTKTALIIDDNPIIVMQLEDILRDMGFHEIYTATNYKDAIYLYEHHRPRIALLDIDLDNPHKNGIDIAVFIRNKADTMPILFISADDSIETIQKCAPTSPSAYLTKPFNLKEVRTAINFAWYGTESRMNITEETIRLSEVFTYDPLTKYLYEYGTPIMLTPNEKKLIEIFAKNPYAVVPKSAIVEHIWTWNIPDSDSTVRTLFYRLNKKLRYKLFEKIPGIGYKITQKTRIL